MLKVNYDGSDLSREQSRFEHTTSSVAFDGTKYLYLGHRKPIHSLFLNLTDNVATRTLTVEYWNGTAWTAVEGLEDHTFGLTTDGFVSWDKNQEDEAATTHVTLELFWVRLRISAATISFKGIGPLFSDDHDLAGVYPTILDHLPEGANSFVRFHESARKAIITDLRKTGYTVKAEDATKPKQIDEYDVLDIGEVREASKYLTLSKIFSWLSDAADDKYERLSAEYKAEAAGALTPLISLDSDDDGLEDDEETSGVQVVLVGRA